MKREFKLANELRCFLVKVKEEIASCLILIYKSKHNGLLPNWENGEEIVVSADDINKYFSFYIKVNNEKEYIEQKIKTFIVTLDGSLYFRDMDNDEYEWDELLSDDIVSICEYLQTIAGKLS